VTTTTTAEERILVLTPTGRDAALTCALLEKAGFSAATCKSLDDLCECYEGEGAAVFMIAEEAFSTAGRAKLTALLAKQSAWSDIPVLIFTGVSASTHVPLASSDLLSIGNVTLLDRPVRPVTMLSAVRSALRARHRQYTARSELLAQQRAVRERDQFLAMLGHELRNPLGAIAMALELDRGQLEHADVMRRQVRHLTRLIDDLLDVSRVTSGKIVLRREELDLRAVLQRTLQAVSVGLSKDIRVRELPSEARPVWVNADPVRIEQVITNLIQNALKYTPAGGSVEVSVQAEAERAVLRVRDTGDGLEPDMLERVFELFTQADRTLDRAKGGMGIGLTLVRSLVTMHGGTVTAQSPGLGKGSLFTVKLPLSKGPCEQAPAHTDGAPEHRATNGRAQPCEVLIVEDNDDTRELLVARLERNGHRISTAVDGPSGVKAALAHRPQVLLVDIGLPELDGYGVAQQIRAELGSSVYMVAMTGYGQLDDRKRALEAGFDLHLIKPVDLELLDRVLEREARKLAR
jgi:signal transduction histidine kinase/ActR/RegA family two-component response regulator